MEPRLRAVAELLLPDAAVADIGAGEGRLARHLALQGLRVIATERSPGAFRRLMERLPPTVEVRFGDGLDPIRVGEVEQVVIAGMGPMTMARILRRAADRLAEWRRLVLLPHWDGWLVRRVFPELRLRIVDERLVRQRGRIYQAIACRLDEQTVCLAPLELLLGPVNLKRGGEELRGLALNYLRRFRLHRPPGVPEEWVEELEALCHGF